MKKNTALYLAIIIPILMIVVTVLGVSVTQNKQHPKQNFLYFSTNDYKLVYSCPPQLRSLLLNTPLDQPVSNSVDCRYGDLYVYDFNTHASKKVTLQEAQQMHFVKNTQDTSSDGYRITQYCNNDFWFFGGSYVRSMCLNKGTYQKVISPDTSSNQFSDFIAWIQE